MWLLLAFAAGRTPKPLNSSVLIGPRSSGDRAPASGAGCAGSNPAGGTDQTFATPRRGPATSSRSGAIEPISVVRKRFARSAGVGPSTSRAPATLFS